MLNRTMTAAVLSSLMLSPELAQARTWDSMPALQLAQKIPSKSVEEGIRNQKLADAASINEDLIGFALEGKADKVAEQVAAMRKAHATLRPLLDHTAFETLTGQIIDMEQASSKKDVLGTALVA